MFKKTFIACILSIGAFSASAEIVGADLNTQGDGQAFIDTRLGTEWIKLQLTQGMSINEAQEMYGYAGFKVADQDDMLGLIESMSMRIGVASEANIAGFTSVLDGVSDSFGAISSQATTSRGAGYQGAAYLLGKLGVTHSASRSNWGRTYSYGLFTIENENGEVDGRSASVNTYWTGTNRKKYRGDIGISSTVVSSNYTSSGSGVFMLAKYSGKTLSAQQDATLVENFVPDVNAPICLAALGLAGMFAVRRKNKS